MGKKKEEKRRLKELEKQKATKKDNKKIKEERVIQHCGNCGHCVQKDNKTVCQIEGPTLFLVLFNRYLSIGFTEADANKKSWFQCEVDVNYICKHWNARTKNQPAIEG